MSEVTPVAGSPFAAECRHTPPRYASRWMLLLAGSVFGLFFVYLASTGQPEQLVPVTSASILHAIPLLLLLYPLGVVLVVAYSKAPHPAGFFTLFFSLRIGLAVILALVFQFDDEWGFHVAGEELPYGLLSWNAGSGYYHLVGMLYAAFDSSLLLPKVFNAFVGSLLAFVAHGLAQRLFGDPHAARRAFLLAGLLPPAVVFSSVNLKEIATAFLVLLISWLLVAQQRGTSQRLLGILVIIAALYWLRGPVWAVVGATGVATYLFMEAYRGSSSGRRRSLTKASVALGGLIVMTLALRPVIVEPIAEMVTSRLTEETYFIQRFGQSEATVMQFVDIDQPLSPRTLLVLFFRGLYAPSPLRVLLDFHVATLVEAMTMAAWYLVFSFAVLGFWIERHRPAVAALGVMLIAVLAVATMGEVVGADSYRHRMVGVGIACTLAGYGWNKGVYSKHPWPLRLWWVGAVLFSGGWLALRA